MHVRMASMLDTLLNRRLRLRSNTKRMMHTSLPSYQLPPSLIWQSHAEDQMCLRAALFSLPIMSEYVSASDTCTPSPLSLCFLHCTYFHLPNCQLQPPKSPLPPPPYRTTTTPSIWTCYIAHSANYYSCMEQFLLQGCSHPSAPLYCSLTAQLFVEKEAYSVHVHSPSAFRQRRTWFICLPCSVLLNKDLEMLCHLKMCMNLVLLLKQSYCFCLFPLNLFLR